jgi:hypothetical protein
MPHTREYTPTPSEIRMACKDIQRCWSPRERAKRSPHVRRVMPMLVSTRELDEAREWFEVEMSNTIAFA